MMEGPLNLEQLQALNDVSKWAEMILDPGPSWEQAGTREHLANARAIALRLGVELEQVDLIIQEAMGQDTPDESWPGRTSSYGIGMGG